MARLSSLQLPLASSQTLGNSVAAALRDAIFNGVFKPGDRLAQAHVASDLGVSQAPVREALAALEREGLVERGPRSGAAVTLLSPADIEEICSLRTTLEVLAVRRAVRRASAEDFAQMQATIDATEQETIPARVAALDLQFHELFVRAAKHQRLLACWQSLQAQLKLALLQQGLAHSQFAHVVADGHRELLAQFQARNEERAVALLEEQLERFHQSALRLNPEPGADGPAPRQANKTS